MVSKEEGTALLLTLDEPLSEDHHKVKHAKPNSYIAAALAVSCLCGAGIFLSAESVWCYESVVSCGENYLLRFYVLIGSILSALLSGRAVDFFGRRSSVIYAAVCWLLSAVFLTYFVFWHVNYQGKVDIPTQHLKSHQSTDIPLALINSSGIYNHSSQSLLFDISPLPPKPFVVRSGDSNGSHRSTWYLTRSSNANVDFLNARDEPPLPLKIIASLLLGGASSASIVSASVYVFEISRIGVRARYIALSDFLCVIFGISFPLININILILSVAACLPVILIGILLLLPFKVPNFLSFPHSPYHLLLKSIIEKKKSCGGAGKSAFKRTRKNCIHNLLNYFSSYSEKTNFSFTHIMKPHFCFPRNKIYDLNCRKSSVSDGDDISFCVNEIAKESEVEQMASAERRELASNYTSVCSEEEGLPQSGMKCVEGPSAADCDEGAIMSKVTEKDYEARKSLSYLYGTCEGEDEADAIYKEFLMDPQCGNLSYFNTGMNDFHTTVFKLGYPLIIIYMCASDSKDVAALTSSAMSKLSFRSSTSEAALSCIKIISAALSMFLVDKIAHKRALLNAAIVLATSSLLLGVLSSHVMLNVEEHQDTIVTTLPSRPTMYPLLPTPLPQLLQWKDGRLHDEWTDSNYLGSRPLHSDVGASDSLVVWLTLVSVIFVIGSGTIVLTPLTRVFILSAFPTCSRGSGLAFTFAMQYLVHLIWFFLPRAYFRPSFILMFRSGACFVSLILLLCFLKSKNRGQRCVLHSFNDKFHLLFNGKIHDMSTANSTAV